MGCFAPSPYLDAERIDDIVDRILQPAVDGMRRRGTPYVGVLYGGLMISTDGMQVLEFNCRFGDPETQVILPLLESDLVDVMEACLEGRLADEEIRWSDLASACVVLASGGYPGAYETGHEIRGVTEAGALPDVAVFHAGTRRENGRLVTAGGRVLATMGTGPALGVALDRAYAAAERISFEGCYYRRDIGGGR
jgi:phosphoribosylamine--glycine ligase